MTAPDAVSIMPKAYAKNNCLLHKPTGKNALEGFSV